MQFTSVIRFLLPYGRRTKLKEKQEQRKRGREKHCVSILLAFLPLPLR